MSRRQQTAWDTVTHALAKVTGGGGRNGQWICPAHDDRNPSLSVALGDDGHTVVIRCHAGCPTDDVLAALDLTVRDLFEKPEKSNGTGKQKSRIVDTYDYTDEAGELLFQVVRLAPKSFRQRRPDGRGGWLWKLGDTRRVLYKLPEVVAAVERGEPVFVCEGEKDADAIARADAVATCNPGGAGKFGKVADVGKVLAGAEVVVVIDDDEAGHAHGRQVAEILDPHVAVWTVARSTTAKDVAEHLGQGHDLEELEVLARSDGEPGRAWLDGTANGERTPLATDEARAGGTNETPESDRSGARIPDDTEAVRPPSTYRSTRLADVQPERVSWLWPSRLPVGKLATVDGDPDVGKSTVALDLAARLTTGRPMPGEDLATVPVSSVVLMAAEDGLGDTIRPRLDAAGADTTRVHHFDAVPVVDDEGQVTGWVPPTIPDDLTALESLITSTEARLVIVDVLMAYLSGKADSHRDQDVRRALSQLAEIADRTGACVVLLRHLRKSRGSAMYAGGGSIGIVGIARAGMVAAADPNEPDRRVLARSKGNLAPPYPSLAYRLVSDESHGCATVEWLGEVETTGDQLLAPPESDEERSALDEAVDWLRDVLADGARRRADVVKDGRPEGHTERTLARAADRLGVISERDQSIQGRPSTWRLP